MRKEGNNDQEIVAEETRYLGYQLRQGEVRPQVDKVTAILDCPQPYTKKEVWSFLRLIGWYRGFVAQFAIIAAPLTALAGKNYKWCDVAELPHRVCSSMDCRQRLHMQSHTHVRPHDNLFSCSWLALSTTTIIITPFFSPSLVMHTLMVFPAQQEELLVYKKLPWPGGSVFVLFVRAVEETASDSGFWNIFARHSQYEGIKIL